MVLPYTSGGRGWCELCSLDLHASRWEGDVVVLLATRSVQGALGSYSPEGQFGEHDVADV